MTERELQDLFREMREEPIPADSLTRVRMAVEQQTGRKNWRAAWKLASVLVLAGCLVAGFLLLRPARKIVPVRPPEIQEIAKVMPPPEVAVRTLAPPKHVRRPQRVQTVPVMIRIETPDPDVVILLVN